MGSSPDYHEAEEPDNSDQRIHGVRERNAHNGKLTPRSGASLRTPMRATLT